MKWTALAAAAALVLAVAMVSAQNAAPGYVGTSICMRCHIDFAKQWATVSHSKALLKADLPPERSGCEACHGPGSDHVAGDRKKIRAWDKLEVPEKSKVCLQCHAPKVTEALWQAGPHAAMVSCEHCHEVHQPVKRDHLLRPAEGTECMECHSDLAERIKAKTHHTLADGALTCDVCHSFHGSTQRHLLVAAQKDLCANCHDKTPKPDSHKREGWKLKHGADAKGHQAQCTMCHDEQSFCNTCHVVSLPHPKDWPLSHADAGRKHQDACLKCHQAEMCKMCHAEVPVKPDKAAAK